MPYDASHDLHATGGKTDAPASQVVAVTPSDSTDLTHYATALYVGTAGNVAVIPINNADGAPVTFTAHASGYMPVRVRRVLATGTTASNILALVG